MKRFFSDIINQLYKDFDILVESLYNSICLEVVRMIVRPARSNCDGNEGDKLFTLKDCISRIAN